MSVLRFAYKGMDHLIVPTFFLLISDFDMHQNGENDFYVQLLLLVCNLGISVHVGNFDS